MWWGAAALVAIALCAAMSSCGSARAQGAAQVLLPRADSSNNKLYCGRYLFEAHGQDPVGTDYYEIGTTIADCVSGTTFDSVYNSGGHVQVIHGSGAYSIGADYTGVITGSTGDHAYMVISKDGSWGYMTGTDSTSTWTKRFKRDQ